MTEKKRKSSGSPTSRTLAECRKRGWIAQVVEQNVRIPGGGMFKRDLLGCIDVFAVCGDHFLGIQACAGTDHAKRRAKALAEPRLGAWLAAGGRFEVWSWAKQGPHGARKLWTLRAEALTVADFAATAPLAPPPEAPRQWTPDSVRAFNEAELGHTVDGLPPESSAA